MSAPARKPAKRKQPRARPIYFTVRKVVDLETGEQIGALVPMTQWDRRTMRERKFTTGSELRCDGVKKRRNVKWFRLGHALGGWLADNVEGFEGLAQHDALKKLQIESGIGVVEEEFDLGQLGIVKRRVAESLNFDDMDEGRWSELWDGGNGEGGWIGWLRANKFGALNEYQREEVELMITKEAQ